MIKMKLPACTKKLKVLMKSEEGWTFVETLIVISIVAILTSTVSLLAVKSVGKAKVVAVKTQIENLSMALDTYFMDNMRYPIEEQGLVALWEKPIIEPVPEDWDGPYLKKNLAKDPWKNDYEYVVPGPNGLPYGISSFGADKTPGGEGAGKDITSWEN